MSETDTFRGVSRRWQIALLAGAAVLIVAMLLAVYLLWIRQPYVVLFRDLRTADAATIVAELDKRKTPYRLADGGRTILAPQNLVDATRLAVMSEDLPLKGVVGFELFSKSDMGLTEFAQRINYRRALQGEIARTIMALDEVESVRVHLSLSEPTVFREDHRPSKASVTIIPRAGRRLSPHSVRGIQRLVAAAVADLDPADVVILDQNGEVISGVEAPAAPAPIAAASPLDQERAAIEAFYAGRVRMALHDLAPGDAAVVSVTAAPPAAEASASALADWSPQARRFPLTVSVATPQAQPDDRQAAVRAAAAQAIGPAVAGDVVLVTVAPPPEAVAAPQVITLRRAPPQRAPAPPSPALNPAWVQLPLAALAALVGAALVLHRRRAGRRLSERERATLTHQLRRLLDEGDGDALSRR